MKNEAMSEFKSKGSINEGDLVYLNADGTVSSATPDRDILTEAIQLIGLTKIKFEYLKNLTTDEGEFIEYLKSIKDGAMKLTAKADELPIGSGKIDRDIFFGILDNFDNLFLYYFHDEFLRRKPGERQELFEASLGRIGGLIGQAGSKSP